MKKRMNISLCKDFTYQIKTEVITFTGYKNMPRGTFQT